MKKNYFILVILLIMVVGYAATQMKIDIKGNTTLSENTSDFNVYLANLKLNGTEIEGINETKDGYEINVPSKGTLEYDVINDSTEYDVEATVECEEETGTNEVTNFDYTGREITFVAPVTGVYKLETWGAQGGSYSSNYFGGYGGYSVGYVNLAVKNLLYVNVGSAGNYHTGGYNGGGYVNNANYGQAGGGATHIALKSGLLSTLENNKDNILIVSGGGGGAANRGSGYGDGNGGASGGFIGNNGESINHTNGFGYGYGTGGTQIAGGTMVWTGATAVSKTFPGTFGKGYGSTAPDVVAAGGGAGFYGGGGSYHGGAGGGSSYIGNESLANKVMYCYNCKESTEESTKTISTTCANSTPTENCAKSGNGYARITQMSPAVSSTQLEATTIEAQDKLNKSVEVSNNGMTCSLKIKKLSRTEKKVYTGPTEWTFDYTGGEQTFIAPVTGTYKLETWGAQGGVSTYSKTGGFGSYSTGKITLQKGSKSYINIGGAGSGNGKHEAFKGGYNGGGDANIDGDGNVLTASGGGATHIASKSGILSTLSEKLLSIFVVASGGGGGGSNTAVMACSGGNGGGIQGGNGDSYKEGAITLYGIGASQTFGGNFYDSRGNTNPVYHSIGSFGQAATCAGVGGGGGLYGGGCSAYSAGGGSGYIGNVSLTEKVMYCYNCEESTEESTKTISTTCVNETPTENCAKSGNGYARISLINN